MFPFVNRLANLDAEEKSVTASLFVDCIAREAVSFAGSEVTGAQGARNANERTIVFECGVIMFAAARDSEAKRFFLENYRELPTVESIVTATISFNNVHSIASYFLLSRGDRVLEPDRDLTSTPPQLRGELANPVFMTERETKGDDNNNLEDAATACNDQQYRPEAFSSRINENFQLLFVRKPRILLIATFFPGCSCT